MRNDATVDAHLEVWADRQVFGNSDFQENRKTLCFGLIGLFLCFVLLFNFR